MKQSESDIQKAIFDALVWDGWLAFRLNQGVAQYDDGFDLKTGTIKKRYVSFVVWQALGIDQQDSGMSDVLAMKWKRVRFTARPDFVNALAPTGYVPHILAVEVKAPGKADKLRDSLHHPDREVSMLFKRLNKREQNQARFLWAVQDHGGTAIVADCLEDVMPYLDRAKVQ